MTKIYMKPGRDIKDICNPDTIFPIATRAFARIQITRTAASNKASAAMVQPKECSGFNTRRVKVSHRKLRLY